MDYETALSRQEIGEAITDYVNKSRRLPERLRGLACKASRVTFNLDETMAVSGVDVRFEFEPESKGTR